MPKATLVEVMRI
jgi:hypothetical protein